MIRAKCQQSRLSMMSPQSLASQRVASRREEPSTPLNNFANSGDAFVSGRKFLGREKKFQISIVHDHIINTHLRGDVIKRFGIPRYDLELMHFLGGRGSLIVEAIFQRIERPIDAPLSALTIFQYRSALIKTLMLIESMSLSAVDYSKLYKLFPEWKDVTLSLDEDCKDAGFYKR